MNILVLNSGSSSLKFQIIDTDMEKIESMSDKQLAKGLIERIGSAQSVLSFEATGSAKVKNAKPIKDHKDAIQEIIKWITSPDSNIPGISGLNDIHAVGHRTVHGGEKFTSSVRVDSDVIAGIEDCIDLAPLHNPANLKGIHAAKEAFGPNVPQVAVFDTAFHSTMPEEAYLYPVPYQYYSNYKVRKYGFHGTSHRFVSYRFRKLKNMAREDANIITMHMGNGCSACAIKNGYSIDTTMGMTPLEGMMMGTRSGDVDPSIVEYIAHKEGVQCEEVFNTLNKRSGLTGISGITNDMRDLEDEMARGDRRATLAIEMFCYRAKKFIGSYMAVLNGAQAICFTGGIGENGDIPRSLICKEMECLGIEIDEELNKQAIRGREMKISKPTSRVEVWVIPTNEELIIARDTYRIVANIPQPW
jgi:acetate kinase